LTDPKKRDLYDRYGERGLQEGGAGAGMKFMHFSLYICGEHKMIK